jgi:hypothetical protein
MPRSRTRHRIRIGGPTVGRPGYVWVCSCTVTSDLNARLAAEVQANAAQHLNVIEQRDAPPG